MIISDNTTGIVIGIEQGHANITGTTNAAKIGSNFRECAT